MNDKSFGNELNAAKYAAKKVGRIQIDMFPNKKHVIRKSPKELVSKIDIESQSEIIHVLKKECHDYEVFSEEKTIQQAYPEGKLFWIVDPLDGTHNYIAGLPFFGVSIALADIHNFYVGVIFLPAFDTLFWAVRHHGAYCNNVKIASSDNKDLAKGLVTYDNQFYLSHDSFHNYRKLVEKTFTTRITGSAVYDLCLVASGKIDARIYNATKIYDVAAGAVLVNEAGGKITDFQGRPLTTNVKDVIASNGKVHKDIMEILNHET